jgi:predicted dehydrogenase
VRTTVPERADAHGHARRCTAETGFTASLCSETGVAMTLDSSATAPVERPSRVIVIGRDGVLEMRSDNPHEIGGWIELHTGAGSTELLRVDQHGDNHRLEMAPYAEVVRDALWTGTTGPDVPSFVDGVACAAIMDCLTPRPAQIASEE